MAYKKGGTFGFYLGCVCVCFFLLFPLAGCAAQTAAVHKAVMQWTASTESSVTAYNVYRGACASSSAPPVKVATVPVGTTTYTDATVAPGQTYCYTVRVTDGTNESVDSNAIAATIPLFLPVILNDVKPF